jgi:hypothetical protein
LIVLVEDKEGADRGDDFRTLPKMMKMISNTIKINKHDGHLKDVKLILEPKVMVQDVSDEKYGHNASC